MGDTESSEGTLGNAHDPAEVVADESAAGGGLGWMACLCGFCFLFFVFLFLRFLLLFFLLDCFLFYRWLLLQSGRGRFLLLRWGVGFRGT